MKRRIVDWDEYDLVTGWRKVVRWQRGEIRKLKRRINKRERQDGKRQAREEDS